MSIDQQILSDLSESSSKEDATVVIINILKTIEYQPLRASEMRNIYKTIHRILQKYELQDNYQLESLVKYRFSMEYIPSINSLSTKISTIKSIAHENLSETDINGRSSGSEDKISRKVVLNDTADAVQSNYYYLCSIHKHQSTLSTSYRLFLDGTKEIHPITKEVSNCIMNDKPIMILGAKKFKYKATISSSSSSSDSNSNIVHSYIWNHMDSKLWKEKNAIGRLTRMNPNRYIGILLPIRTQQKANLICNTKSSNQDLLSMNNSNSSNNSFDSTYLEGSIAISVHSRGLDKLIHLNAAAIRPRLSTVNSNNNNNNTNSSSSDYSSSGKQQDLYTDSNSDIQSSSSSTYDINNHNTSDRQTNGGVTTVVDIIYPTTTSTTSSSIVNEKEIMNSMESLLLNHMATVSSDNKTTSPTVIVGTTANAATKSVNNNIKDEDILYLKSKQPRNVYDNKGKIIHTVVFSKESRVKAPSRKNLVIDTINTTEQSSTEWIVDSNKPALIQIGKLEEGLFSLDFYDISPFQAFSIALAAFDQ